MITDMLSRQLISKYISCCPEKVNKLASDDKLLFLLILFQDRTGQFLRKLSPKMILTKAVIGINPIGGYLKEIATFLGLENPERYTNRDFKVGKFFNGETPYL
jgi:hypothetical protein